MQMWWASVLLVDVPLYPCTLVPPHPRLVALTSFCKILRQFIRTLYNGIYMSGRHVGHPQALQGNRSKSCLFHLHCGIPNAHMFQLHKQKYISLYKLNLLYDGFNLLLCDVVVAKITV